MAKHNEIGKLGEIIAEKYLIKNNFKIIEKNFNCLAGEIDIIAQKVLVKPNLTPPSPETSIGHRKTAMDKILEKRGMSNKKIYFIEVKAKKVMSFNNLKDISNDPFGPENNFSYQKKKRMLKTIKYYLFKNKLNLDIDCDIMLIIVYINEELKQGKVKVYESVTLN